MSPELLVFVFFMMSDPQTAPKSRDGRIVYGAATAVIAAGLTYFQPTEFGMKLAILSSLVVVCALVPLIERALDHRGVPVGTALPVPAKRGRLVGGARNPARRRGS